MIHLVTGMQGSGKTLLLVAQAYRAYCQGKKIYSNVDLNFPYLPMDYNDIVECRYENALVLIDEVHQLLPSRRSMSEINVNIVDNFLSMVRKKNLEIWGSTQLQRKVDIRFREEADYIYLCERWAYIDNIWKKLPSSQVLDAKVPIKIEVMVCESFSGRIKQFSFDGNVLYNLYDTTQVIKVRGIR